MNRLKVTYDRLRSRLKFLTRNDGAALASFDRKYHELTAETRDHRPSWTLTAHGATRGNADVSRAVDELTQEYHDCLPLDTSAADLYSLEPA